MIRRLSIIVAACGLLAAACGGNNSGGADSTAPPADTPDVGTVEVGAADNQTSESAWNAEVKEADGFDAYVCVPDCLTGYGGINECGDNGCGGSCGDCATGYQCVDSNRSNGERSCFSYDDCPLWCEGWSTECGELRPFWEGDEGIVCDCGPCTEGQVCLSVGEEDASFCCTPDCTGKECGPDGCGGSCGACPAGCACDSGVCQGDCDCVSYCGEENEAECGDDGCGGSCGECDPEEVCGEADYDAIGICFDPVKQCPETCAWEEAECGPVWTGLAAPEDCNCGDCPGPQDECINNTCVCQPQAEVCDGLDNDCDGEIDEDFPDENLDGIPDCCQPQYDGVDPAKDNCPWMKNPGQADTDLDGLGNACDPDDDNDGWDDWQDCEPGSPYIYPGAQEKCNGLDDNCNDKIDEGFPDTDKDGVADCVDDDLDGDGIKDVVDNCMDVFNPGQEDFNGNGIGDACEKDYDNDTVENGKDNCPWAPNPDQKDTDKDGVGDSCEGGDADGDGAPDVQDCQPKNPTSHPGAEELCDAWDNDCDGEVNEGFPYPEGYPVFGNCITPDEDGDNVGDPWDTCPGLPNPGNADLDKDGLGDACDPDMDGDGALNAADCESLDPMVFPGAPETCDGKDNDCDGEADEDAAETDCQDCDPCTVDLCKPMEGGCLHEPVACPEGQACNAWGKCE